MTWPAPAAAQQQAVRQVGAGGVVQAMKQCCGLNACSPPVLLLPLLHAATAPVPTLLQLGRCCSLNACTHATLPYSALMITLLHPALACLCRVADVFQGVQAAGGPNAVCDCCPPVSGEGRVLLAGLPAAGRGRFERWEKQGCAVCIWKDNARCSALARRRLSVSCACVSVGGSRGAATACCQQVHVGPCRTSPLAEQLQ